MRQAIPGAKDDRRLTPGPAARPPALWTVQGNHPGSEPGSLRLSRWNLPGLVRRAAQSHRNRALARVGDADRDPQTIPGCDGQALRLEACGDGECLGGHFEGRRAAPESQGNEEGVRKPEAHRHLWRVWGSTHLEAEVARMQSGRFGKATAPLHHSIWQIPRGTACGMTKSYENAKRPGSMASTEPARPIATVATAVPNFTRPYLYPPHRRTSGVV